MNTPARRLLEAALRTTQMPDDPDETLMLVTARDWRWLGLSNGEQAMIEVALSLEYGRSVDLAKALAVMDAERCELCLDAMTEMAGLS